MRHKAGFVERAHLLAQGVLFDSDEEGTGTTLVKHTGRIPVIKVSGNSLERDGTIASMDGDDVTSITGTAQVYTDATDSSNSNLSDGDCVASTKLRRRQSDGESIKTEDFEDKYRELTTMSAPQGRGNISKEWRKSTTWWDHLTPEAAKIQEHRKALLSAGFYVDKHGQLRDRLLEKERKRPSKGRHHHHPQQAGKGGRQEAMEYLHQLLLQQQETSPDKLPLDSDLETVKSLLVHNKFKQALHESGITDNSEFSSSDTESANDRIQKKGSSLPIDRSHTLPGKLTPYVVSLTDLKKSSKHKKNNHHRLRRVVANHLDVRYMQDDNGSSSASSACEEQSSLGSSSDSLRTGMHTSSTSTEERVMASSSRHATFFDYDQQMAWRCRKQVSTDRSSNSTSVSTSSRTNSTFDEVESLDLGGSHEVELDPNFLAYREFTLPTHLDRRALECLKQSLSKAEDKSDKLERASSSTDDSKPSDEQSRSSHRRGRDLILPDDEEGDAFTWRSSSSSRQYSEASSSTGGESRASSLINHMSLMEQLLQYKQQRVLPSDSMSSTSSFSPSSGSSHDFMRMPYETDYEYQLRHRRSVSTSSGAASNAASLSGILSRNISMESTSSSYSSSSPSDLYGNMYGMHGAAEDILSNLGFCKSDSFLPERFAKDWFEKIMRARQEKIQYLQQLELQDMLEGLDTPSLMRSGTSTPAGQRYGSITDFLHSLDVNSRANLANAKRSQFKRSATVMTYHQSNMKPTSQEPQASASWQDDFKRHDSIDELKFLLERQASILGENNIKDRKRKQFATGRQKSLPLCLETLSEEEEGRSRTASLDRGHMKTFFEEEERLSRSSSRESDLSRLSGEQKPNSSHINRPSSSSAASDTSSSYSLTDIDNKFDMHEYKQQSVETFEMVPSGEGDSNRKSPMPTIPAIVVNSNRYLPSQSSSSLEIAEIMESTRSHKRGKTKSKQLNKNDATFLNVEPAMISVVLSDIEDTDKRSSSTDWRGRVNSEDKLCPPSPTSTSSSISPIPISPVTVIEMDHLDNQDSIDSGESQPEEVSVKELPTSLPMCSLQPISEEEFLSSDQSRSASVDDASIQGNSDVSDTLCWNKQQGVAVQANDGRLSPIMFYHRTLLPVNTSFDGGSESSFTSYKDDQSNKLQKNVRNISIQEDDGRLSPIMFFPRQINNEDKETYLAMDQATQCDTSLVSNSTQTQVKYKMATTQTPEWQPSWTKSTEEETMYVCCSVSTQTDIEPEHSSQESNPLTIQLHPMMNCRFVCSNCKATMSMISENSSLNLSTDETLQDQSGLGDAQISSTSTKSTVASQCNQAASSSNQEAHPYIEPDISSSRTTYPMTQEFLGWQTTSIMDDTLIVYPGKKALEFNIEEELAHTVNQIRNQTQPDKNYNYQKHEAHWINGYDNLADNSILYTELKDTVNLTTTGTDSGETSSYNTPSTVKDIWADPDNADDINANMPSYNNDVHMMEKDIFDNDNGFDHIKLSNIEDLHEVEKDDDNAIFLPAITKPVTRKQFFSMENGNVSVDGEAYTTEARRRSSLIRQNCFELSALGLASSLSQTTTSSGDENNEIDKTQEDETEQTQDVYDAFLSSPGEPYFDTSPEAFENLSPNRSLNFGYKTAVHESPSETKNPQEVDLDAYFLSGMLASSVLPFQDGAESFTEDDNDKVTNGPESFLWKQHHQASREDEKWYQLMMKRHSVVIDNHSQEYEDLQVGKPKQHRHSLPCITDVRNYKTPKLSQLSFKRNNAEATKEKDLPSPSLASTFSFESSTSSDFARMESKRPNSLSFTEANYIPRKAKLNSLKKQPSNERQRVHFAPETETVTATSQAYNAKAFKRQRQPSLGKIKKYTAIDWEQLMLDFQTYGDINEPEKNLYSSSDSSKHKENSYDDPIVQSFDLIDFSDDNVNFPDFSKSQLEDGAVKSIKQKTVSFDDLVMKTVYDAFGNSQECSFDSDQSDNSMAEHTDHHEQADSVSNDAEDEPVPPSSALVGVQRKTEAERHLANGCVVNSQPPAAIVASVYETVKPLARDEEHTSLLAGIALDYSLMKAVNQTIDHMLLTKNSNNHYAEVDKLLKEVGHITGKK